MQLYSFNDYRDLVDWVLAERWGRGSKVRLAQELNCQPGYISQVLSKSKIHFSPENLHKIATLFSLAPTEHDYLMTLLFKEKAGSKELEKYFSEKARRIQRENLKIEKQIRDAPAELGDVDKAVYYSHWAYSAIHMLVSIDEYRSEAKISEKLRLPSKFTNKVLSFLSEKNLIKHEGEKFSLGTARLHLKSDSPLVKAHHQNYRSKSVQSLENDNEFDLHYSSVMTLSHADAERIRSLILELISEKEKILLPSPNEEMICLNVDLFKF